jgi:hypothetical protein
LILPALKLGVHTSLIVGGGFALDFHMTLLHVQV